MLPPSLEETAAILKGLKERYEKHHNVTISDEVVQQTVRLSDRYMSERFMPDKAIDLLDEAAAYKRVETDSVTEVARRILREMKLVRSRMEDAVAQEDFELAARQKTKLARLEQELETENVNARPALELTEEDVAQSVGFITGIPTKRILKKKPVIF